MAKWITAKEGVRYREHPTRKHGVTPDRYYVLRYRDADGKRQEEALGWSSQKGWTTKKASEELHRLKANHTTGIGPQSMREGRDIKKKEQLEAEKAQKLKEKQSITFSEVFKKYIIYSQNNKRSEKSWKREEQLNRIHIFPIFGNLSLTKISQIQFEQLKIKMSETGSSARTIRYALAVIRQVFNFAIREELYSGLNLAAGGKIARPKEDNRKDRYLTKDEAELLLSELLKHSHEVHDMSMLSLYTGMRFGEIANLKWGNVDTAQGIIMLRKTKSGKDRAAYMTDSIKKMFERRFQNKPGCLVFPARGKENKPHLMISRVYYDVVAKLFNKGIEDKKLWVNFHTLRHTFASWLVEHNTDLYIIKDLLGHHDLKTTERYAHIGENQLKQAVMKLEF